jgi:hypothetical protein
MPRFRDMENGYFFDFFGNSLKFGLEGDLLHRMARSLNHTPCQASIFPAIWL